MNTRYRRYEFVSVKVTRVNSCEQKNKCELEWNESEQQMLSTTVNNHCYN